MRSGARLLFVAKRVVGVRIRFVQIIGDFFRDPTIIEKSVDENYTVILLGIELTPS